MRLQYAGRPDYEFSARMQSTVAGAPCVKLDDDPNRLEVTSNCADAYFSARWQFYPDAGANVYTIRNEWTGQCLTVRGNQRGDPASVEACDASDQQRFTLEDRGDKKRIVTHTGQQLDRHASQFYLIQWTDEGDDKPNQRWWLGDWRRGGQWELRASTTPDADPMTVDIGLPDMLAGDRVCVRSRAFRGNEASDYSEHACAVLEGDPGDPVDPVDPLVELTTPAPAGLTVESTGAGPDALRFSEQ